jgi:hypothetical protein
VDVCTQESKVVPVDVESLLKSSLRDQSQMSSGFDRICRIQRALTQMFGVQVADSESCRTVLVTEITNLNRNWTKTLSYHMSASCAEKIRSKEYRDEALKLVESEE